MKIGFNDGEIITDLNTFPSMVTLIVDHDGSTLELIKTVKLVSMIYPKINLVLDISSLSFTSRGNTRFEQLMCCTFLRYTKPVDLNFGTLNGQTKYLIMALGKRSKVYVDR